MKLKIIICLLLYTNAHASAPAQKMNLNNKRPASGELEQQENSKKPKNDSSIPASLKTAANEQKHIHFAALMHNKRTAAKQADYKNMQELFPIPREIPYLAQTMILPFLHSTTSTKLWAKSLEPMELEGSSRAIKAIFSKDGKRIITVHSHPDYSCGVWNAHTGKKITEFPHHRIFFAVSNTQGTRVATEDSTGKILLWDVETNQLLHSLEDIEDTKKHNHWLHAQDIRFSKDDTTLLTINKKGIINRWNIQYGILMQTLKIDTPNSICVSSFNADGSKAVVSCMTETEFWHVGEPNIRGSYIIDTATTQVISPLPCYTKEGVFSPDSTLVATKDPDWIVRIWHTNTGTLIKEIDNISQINNGSISFDNKLMLLRAPFDDYFQLIDTSNWQPIYVSEKKDRITCLLFSPDDTSIFISRQDGTANILKPNAAWEQKKLSWEHKKLTVDQIMLVWLIEQYHPKLIKHNPKHKDKVLKLISYFLSIDHAYLQTIFKSFTLEQQKDLHELYDIVLQ